MSPPTSRPSFNIYDCLDQRPRLALALAVVLYAWAFFPRPHFPAFVMASWGLLILAYALTSIGQFDRLVRWFLGTALVFLFVELDWLRDTIVLMRSLGQPFTFLADVAWACYPTLPGALLAVFIARSPYLDALGTAALFALLPVFHPPVPPDHPLMRLLSLRNLWLPANLLLGSILGRLAARWFTGRADLFTEPTRKTVCIAGLAVLLLIIARPRQSSWYGPLPAAAATPSPTPASRPPSGPVSAASPVR